MSTSDPLAQERDAKFKAWLQNKALRDKAFELLGKLDNERAIDEDTLIEVGVCLRAIDKLLGVDDEKKRPTAPEGEYVPPKEQGASAKKSLKSAWFRWAMEFHAFSMIHLSDADVAGLSGAVQEFLTSEADIIASAGNYGEELDRASRTKNILPSLKYFFPQVPKPGEKARPLTNDQKAQNAIYMREAKKLWRKAGEELNNRVVEYVARALRGGGSSKRRGGLGREEEEAKGKEAGDDFDERGSRGGSAGGKFETPEDRLLRSQRLENQCLHELGLKQLKAWIEADDEKKTNKANEDAMEKLKMAKQSHEQFVKKKDGLRIRLPDNMTAPSMPNMGYGREISGVRAVAKGVSSTVEMMAGTGLKYVHATNKGRKGQMGDLEKSREQLLKMGFVDKANFDAEERDRYERERRQNSVIKEKQEQEAKQREENAKAYEEWIAQKEMRDSALKCLGLVPKPVVEVPPAWDDPRGSGTSVRRSQQQPNNTLATTNPMANPALTRHCLDVGRALKRVDRTLFLDWAKWCERVFSTNVAMVLWDFFAPVACDVHCASYSQVRDTFLKLLRPGVDYRQTFLDYVEKHIFARRVNKFKDEKEYYHLREDAQRELDEELESMRKEWLSEVSLSKEDMRKLLLQMGIALKETEMRALIDAFDSNHDGVITIAEFLDFTGPKRDKRSGNSVMMSQRCCWLTTCKVTGMPGAYSVSAPTKRAQRAEEARGADDPRARTSVVTLRKSVEKGGVYEEQLSDPEDEAGAKQTHAATTLGRVDMVVRKLANGDTRVCIELRERKRREELLRKMGLLEGAAGGDGNGAKSKKAGKGKRDESKRGDGDYEDDFAEEEHDPYGDDFEGDDGDKGGAAGTGKSGKGDALNSTAAAGAACQYSTWRPEDRKQGLKFLLEITRDARQEETLKMLLATGVPPAPPKLFMMNERALETRSLNRRSTGSFGSGKGGHKSKGGRAESKGGDSDDEGEEEGDDDSEQPELGPESTEITVHWGPQAKGDLISFYSLEYGGVVGASKATDVKYTEIFRDPPDSDPSHAFAFSYTMQNLTPGASYRFRIRAFNGFGPGEYTYKTLTTVTAAPTKPRIIKVASDCVWLKWTFTQGFFRRLEELRRIFSLADSDKSGMVSREELTALLDERASASPELKAFLNKVANSLGLVVTQGYDALFDMIEGDDDGGLSWTEFENFFMAAGWGNGPSIAGPGGTTNFSTGGIAQSTLRPGAGPAGAGITITPGDINYVVERCESEVDDRYVEVLRTTLGNGMVNRLEPGKSYRFRVYSLNADGVAGPRSPSVLVHTLVETPAAPAAPPKLIQARKVTISWKLRNCFTGTRNKAFTDKMLGEWAGALGDDEGGVSVRAAFDKYDRDGSGDIDASELKRVLEDLGVDASDERLNEAFDVLDRNKDGVISYEEFGKWWRRDAVSYTLKRSEEVLPLNSALYTALDNGTNRFRVGGSTLSQLLGGTTNPAAATTSVQQRAASRGRGGAMAPIAEEGSQLSKTGRPQSAAAANAVADPAAAARAARQVAVPIVVYRGDKTRCEVMGLTPNRLYHFKLRYVGSRSNSMLSPPLLLMTAPLPTSPPILVDLTHNTVRAKWYPGQYGAFKFAVQMRLADSAQPATNNFSATNALHLTTSSNNAARKVSTGLVGAETEDGWIAVYNGLDNVYTATSLASNTAYQLRVLAINCQGVASDPSEVITFTTLQRSENVALTPKNAGSKFTIECTGDICVGDVILITERLFVKNRPGSATSASAAALRTSQSSLPGGKARGRDGGPVASAKTGAILPNMSVTSLNGTGLDAASITPSRGEYLGERTIAAYVARDNYRTIRDALTAAGVEPRNHKKFGVHRKLWLEVVWQRTADEACKPYDLKAGEVLERMQAHLEQFEVFRCAWREENKRKPLQEEWKAMCECFIQTDC